MKSTNQPSLLLRGGALVLAAQLAIAPLSWAQVAVERTVSATTSAGVVSEFAPDSFIIRSESSPTPLRYSYTKTTQYVDEAGAPVSLELVKSGVPVTVHYTRDGERIVASRVIVHRSAPAGVVEKKTTRTATTTSDGVIANEATTITTSGTVSELGGDALVVTSETSPTPLRYSYTKTTQYVDETGAPVTVDVVKSGLPVTVHYSKTGDQMVARKVVVRRAVTPAPALIEKKSTTTTTTTKKKDKDDDND